MPFSFLLFPWWAVGGLAAAAASIPIIIHLLHRQRTQPIYWGAMMFLKESPLQQRRRKKVDHWLLMLLRVAVVALLVLLISWPRKDKQLSLLGGSGGTDIAVVIDHSLSTGRHTGGSGNDTVFQQSVNAFDQFVKSGAMKATDTVSVVLAEHQPRKLNDRPISSGSADKLVSNLHKLTPGATDASVPDAIQAAREVLSHGRNGKKIVVVLSDHQRAGWKVNDLTAWTAAVGQRVRGVEPDVKVYEMPVLPEAGAANVTVADLRVNPPLLGTARPAVITATVSNTGQKEVPAGQAKLMVTGKQVAQQPVPVLAPGQSQTLRFEYTLTDLNSNWVEVKVDAADSLAEDNQAVASAYVWQTLPVLVIDGQLASFGADSSSSLNTFRTFKNSRFLLNAMLSDSANPDAPPLAKPTVVSVADKAFADPDGKGSSIKLEDYAVVVLNDVPQLPPGLANRLADYARAGHGVWAILGRNSERKYVSDGSSENDGVISTGSLAQAGLIHLALKDQKSVEQAPAIAVKDAANPMLEQLASPEQNTLVGLNTFKWWSVKPRNADARVVLATAGEAGNDGDPLIIERPLGSNGGRVVVWTAPVDKSWSNWPSVPAFAPLVNETIYHLASGTTKGMENRRLESGQPIVWTGAGTPAVGKVTITRPDGSKVERRPVNRDGRQVLSYAETYLPGKYELAFDQSSIPQPVYYGVGIDRNELDETAVSSDDLKWLESDDHKFVQDSIDPSRGLSAALGGGGDGIETIWPLLAVVVLGILLGETYLTYRMIKRQTRPGAEMIPGAGAPIAA